MHRTGKFALLTAATALASALGLAAVGSGQAWAYGTSGGSHGPAHPGHPAPPPPGHGHHGTGHHGTGHHDHGHHGHHPGGPSTPPPTDPTEPPTDPTDPPTDPGDPGEPVVCMALYNLTTETDSGFTATVEVMNHSTEPMTGWTVTWTPGTDTEITEVVDGVLTHNADGTVSVRNVEANATVPPDGAEVTFSFTATSTGNNFPAGSMKCTSP